MCVCVGGGAGGRDEDSVIYVIKMKLCILPPTRIACNFPRDIAWTNVSFQMI